MRELMAVPARAPGHAAVGELLQQLEQHEGLRIARKANRGLWAAKYTNRSPGNKNMAGAATRKVNGGSEVPQKTSSAVLRGADRNRRSSEGIGGKRGVLRGKEGKMRPLGRAKSNWGSFEGKREKRGI
uniref:Uncharacterized protein n=1 Tax=Columba livia TaxID=8932 RepID=R7VVT7_COLLI